jgi:CarD family transcriptional regulator
MAARKKASRKSSRTVAKKTRASPGSAPPRKRKVVAGSSASRSSRSAVKSKAARSTRAKSGKSESARRPSASAKAAAALKRASAAAKARTARASARASPATAAKLGQPVDTKLQVSANQAGEASTALGQEPPGVSDVKASREAPAPAPPLAPVAAPAIAKANASPLAKRAPVAAKAPKPGASDDAAGLDEENSASKTMKSSSHRQGFKLNEFVVYPAHGVGQIVAVEDQEVAGFRLELFVINFAKDKMTLRVPTSKVVGVGMRKLSEPEAAKRSLEILTGRARIKRTMWSRRAQEYEAKINSGDINAIAEVVRDLYRSDAQPEQSYSERQLYEAALDRMMREIAAVQKLSEIDALKAIEGQLKKAQRRGVKSETAESEDAAIEKAA